MLKISMIFLTIFLLITLLLILIYKDPINKLINLIILFLIGGIIILSYDFTFLGLSHIIVYVGAISILFLFIIMLLNLDRVDEKKLSKYFYILILGKSIIMINILDINIIFFEFLNNNYFIKTYYVIDTLTLGIYIYKLYPLIVFLKGFFLLFVLIGIISLIK